MTAINQSAPTEIARKIMCSHAMETMHPSLEAAVIGVHVLHMPGSVNANPSGEIHWMMRHSDVLGHGGQHLAAVSAKNGIMGQKRRQDCPDVQLVDRFEDKVGRIAGAVPCHEDRNLFVGQAALIGLS